MTDSSQVGMSGVSGLQLPFEVFSKNLPPPADVPRVSAGEKPELDSVASQESPQRSLSEDRACHGSHGSADANEGGSRDDLRSLDLKPSVMAERLRVRRSAGRGVKARSVTFRHFDVVKATKTQVKITAAMDRGSRR